MNEQTIIRENIAEYLSLCKDALLVQFRFLDRAFGMLGIQAATDIDCLCTDGISIYYDWQYLQRRLRDETPLERDLLHIILHLVFAHPFHMEGKENRRLWHLSCDIAVENAILDARSVTYRDTRDEERLVVIETLRRDVQYMTAQRIYRHLNKYPLPTETLVRYERLFYVDSHFSWTVTDGVDEDEEGESDYSGVQVTKGRREFLKRAEQDFRRETRAERQNRWETVTKHIRMEQMIHEKKFGEAWGSLVQNIEEVRKDPIDYKQFLMDFAAFGEEMHVNHDEFDYIYYNYGMDLYGNIPLIEPLEYSSEKRVREFAIVLDTSGSCTGEVVQSFLEKTYSVLMTEETFSNKVNIHIIQSDTAIQQDYKIRSVEEMDEFLRTQKLTGFGGTDFRPAFAYIDELIENKEFENLKGILYFTDGYGTYPAEIPDYKTAFVFVDTGTVTPNVPSWAMKVVLEEERLRKEKS